MIEVKFAEGSRTQLCMIVSDAESDLAIDKLPQAADLLFSALQGKFPAALRAEPKPVPVAAPVVDAHAPETSWTDSFTSLAALRRMRNPLYNMFNNGARAVAH